MNTSSPLSSKPAAGARPPLPREILVLVAAALVIALGYGIITPVLPRYARSFDVGITAASAVVSAFALMRLVFAPASGRLITRWGERRVYLWGLLIVALSTGAAAFSQSYLQLLVLRGLGGIGSTMFTVSAMGLLIRLTPPFSRGRASSLYGSAFLFGGIGGPAIGSLLAGFGYRVPFLIYAAALLAATSVVWLLLSHASLQPADGEPEQAALAVRDALKDSAYRAALIGGFANGWANFGARLALIPLFVGAAPGLGDEMTGLVLMVFALANALALAVASRIVDSVGRRPVIITGMSICAVGTGALGLSGQPLPVLILSVIAGAGAGLLVPGQQLAIADVVGANRSGGQALATFQMSQDLGAILGPLLTGFVVSLAGFGWGFAVTGAVLALGALAWMRGRETRPVR